MNDPLDSTCPPDAAQSAPHGTPDGRVPDAVAPPPGSHAPAVGTVPQIAGFVVVG
jgi:hypothetical protein